MTTAVLALLGRAVLAWLGTVAELIGRGMFAAWAYRLGPRVFTNTCANFEASGPGVIGETRVTKSGAYRWVANDRFLFRPGFWGTHTFHTAFPVGSEATLLGGTLRVQGRTPVGTSLFFAVWFACFVGFAIAAARIGNPLAGILKASATSCSRPQEQRNATAQLSTQSAIHVDGLSMWENSPPSLMTVRPPACSSGYRLAPNLRRSMAARPTTRPTSAPRRDAASQLGRPVPIRVASTCPTIPLSISRAPSPSHRRDGQPARIRAQWCRP